jgi:hypothetical protein
VAGKNYYYFSWGRAIINKLRAVRVINHNNQLGFGEIRRDVVSTADFGVRTPYKKGSVRQIALRNSHRITIFLTNSKPCVTI